MPVESSEGMDSQARSSNNIMYAVYPNIEYWNLNGNLKNWWASELEFNILIIPSPITST